MSGIINDIKTLFTNNSPVTSFQATPLNYKVQNTNSVSILMGSEPIAFAQSSSFGINFGTIPLKGIGSAKPQEILQDDFTPTISINSLVMTPGGLNLVQSPGSQSAVLANSSYTILMLGEGFLPIYYFVGCVCNDFNVSLSANAPMSQTMTFTAMDVLDPFGISILVGDPLIKFLQKAEELASFANGVAKFL